MTQHAMLSSLAPATVRAGVEAAQLTSPHAFIRALNTKYDLSTHLDHLLRPLAEEDDLRIANGSGARERWVLAERLPWDSGFFGRGVARLHTVAAPTGPVDLRADTAPEVAALGAALDVAQSRGISYVFAAVEATALPMIRTLQATGFELIETRASYHMRLAATEKRGETRLATEADIPSLARAAQESVNPFDRFHADPAITPEDANRMMHEWVRASIAATFADATIVPDLEAPEAFCTVKHHQEHWEGWKLKLGQPVLSAVSPRHRGWYVRIIAAVHEHLRSVGAEHSFLVTQITNNAVIRSWEKLGYQFGKGEHVFRRLL